MVQGVIAAAVKIQKKILMQRYIFQLGLWKRNSDSVL